MGLSKSELLLYYKRRDIRQAMADGAVDKEVAVKYGDKGFGKRPDIITSPGDILEIVQKGATSFHSSEEIWTNPMQISTTLSRKELEDLRKGWDLVLDIDCPYWELSKLTAKMMLKALNDNGVKRSVSIKFSGNKGFHIGVPFEAFPKMMPIKGDVAQMQTLFPDAARKIALYILDFISENYFDSKGNIIFDEKTVTIEKIKEITGKKISELTKRICSNCQNDIKDSSNNNKSEFICPRCETREVPDKEADYFKCRKCNVLMNKIENKRTLCSCGSNEFRMKFNPLSIIEVDTILISSRHLYRTEFSMHEKSGLVSVPFNPEKIDRFEKEFAKPENVKVSKHRFLDRNNCVPNEAQKLFQNAYDKPDKKILDEREKKEFEKPKDFDIPSQAVPEELFPPCIKKGLLGVKDGKKRFMFALTNFLFAAGWDYDKVEERIKKWNKKNPDSLREQYITGHLRYQKQHKKNAPPPNCDNNMYYKDMGICFRETDTLCQKIKNPLQYSKRRMWSINSSRGKKKTVAKPARTPKN